MSGAREIAETLKVHNVEYIFGIPSVLSQDLLLAECEAAGITYVSTRDERSAAHMADGYARVRSQPGVCIGGMVAGPHLASGLVEPHHSSIPVVVLSNTNHYLMTSDADPYLSHYTDLLSLFRSITKWVAVIDQSSKIPKMVARGFKVATTGRPGPVALLVHDDLCFKESEVKIRKARYCTHYPASRLAPSEEMIKKAADLLVNVERPAILAGGGVHSSQAWSELIEVAELLVAPVATTLMGKGSIPDKHVLSVGVAGDRNAGPFGRGKIANRLIGEADVVVFVGTKADASATLNWTVPKVDTPIIHIDIDSWEIRKNYPDELGVVGDAKLCLKELARVLKMKRTKKELNDAPRMKEIKKLMDEWRKEISSVYNSDEVPIKTPRLMRELQQFITKNTIVVADAGSCSQWVGNFLDALSVGHRNFMMARGAAALGAWPFSLGAQLGAPDKQVFCVVGDGAFGYNIMELETAVRRNIPVIIIVLNNSLWQWEWLGALEALGKAPNLQLSPVSYAKIADAIGGYGVCVERPGEIKDAIANAVKIKKPAVVEVITDPKELAPHIHSTLRARKRALSHTRNH